MNDREKNYESHWWAIVYDQWNEEGRRSQAHEREFTFCRNYLLDIEGPILEAACGTGSILLRLAALGHEMWGFDISAAMLEQLRRKASERELYTAIDRVSKQGLVDFHYPERFAAITVPASAFLLLPTQEEQIAALKNVYEHLEPGGRLLLNFYIPAIDDLLRHQREPMTEEHLGDFVHPESGDSIEVTHRTEIDLSAQTETIYWYFTCGGQTAEVPLYGRWVYKEEFQLLLRLAGFSHWQLYGSPDGAPYEPGGEMGLSYWVVEK